MGCEEHSIVVEKIKRLEYWRDGNGAKGAEQRLQQIEKKVTAILIMVGITTGQSIVEYVVGYL